VPIRWRAVQVTGNGREAPRTFRLGFVLGRLDETLPWLPERRYRGLDRLPFVPFLADLPREVARAWRSYLDAWDDGLVDDFNVARRARDEPAGVGAPTASVRTCGPPGGPVVSEGPPPNVRTRRWLSCEPP
jgi:hypothetical protein